MIKVNCVVSNGLISKISIKGHADYDTLGKDIVCAAVSSIVTTTINNVIALNVMLNMLKELATDYPQNIKIGGLK